MRFVTWNCSVGNFRDKVGAVSTLLPDVLVVQEAEPIDAYLILAGTAQPTFRDRPAPASTRRAIAVLSYTDVVLRGLDASESEYSFCRYEGRQREHAFQVAAVWTWATKDPGTSYRQAHAGVKQYEAWIRQMPTVVLGDFNNNESYKTGNWRELVESLRSVGLVSAYHHFHRQEFGAETEPTYFHHRKESERPWHIDYCFVPVEWGSRIRDVRLGRYEDWRALSDHVPLIVDLDL